MFFTRKSAKVDLKFWSPVGLGQHRLQDDLAVLGREFSYLYHLILCASDLCIERCVEVTKSVLQSANNQSNDIDLNQQRRSNEPTTNRQKTHMPFLF